jgi:hypothetical protein
MPMVPPNAVDRVLTWSDFPPKDRPPPPPGGKAPAAYTFVLSPDEIAANRIGGRYKVPVEPTVRVDFTPQSWVAKYVFQWPQAEQDALLDHEQIHYMIAALCARDKFNALQQMTQQEYKTETALRADIAAARALGVNQDIQKKYDKDTESLPTQNAMKQAIWANAVRAARKFNQPLRAYLQTAALI